MLLDAEHREEDWFAGTTFGVCICGAGPAGITLARALERKGHRVALLEAGGLERTEESQELYKGESLGLKYFPTENARLRYLGGTSQHWSGFSRPLDQRDFRPFEHHPLSGWPISHSDLLPYTEGTERILGLSDGPFVSLRVMGAGNAVRPVKSYRISPIRFGDAYRSDLDESERISLYLNANLVGIRLTENLREVSGLEFRSYDRNEPFLVRAKHYVLCLGGMENPRALLNADTQIPRGIGNESDQVGRYFCEHLMTELGKIVTDAPYNAIQLYYPDDRILAENKCLAFQVLMSPFPQHESTVRRGIDSALCLTSFTERLGELVFSKDPICFDGRALSYVQQALNPLSRIALSRERDRFGLRRIKLIWQLSELDYHTMGVAAMEFAKHIAESGIGRMQLAPWLRPSSEGLPRAPDLQGTYHHMCTTRMSDDPNTGVVDSNCRVHGIENLFLGGSSVFPTTGLSNPTYTIVQLALRLGDHLHSRLS